MVPQSIFLAETCTRIPQVLDFDEGDKIEYNLLALLDVARGVKVDAEREAFGFHTMASHWRLRKLPDRGHSHRC